MRVFNPLRDPMCWHATEYRNDAPQLPDPVLTKTDFARRYKAGEFGNASPTWNNLIEMEDQGALERCSMDDLFHIRNRVAGGPTWYNVQAHELADEWFEATEVKCIPQSQLYISAMCPTELTRVQGEVMRHDGQLEFFCSFVKQPMRVALHPAFAQSLKGIVALEVLRWGLNTASYEWLMHLLDVYPDHVVEITALDCCWGTEPGFNTLYWEVGKY